MEYDFKSLFDYDFELLCCDLLSALLKKRIENFRRGKDLGIDLRYAGTSQGRIVVQCKHFANTPFSGLYRAVVKEYPKIKKLNPERYLLITSYPLTPGEKERLFDVLKPYCKSIDDILGGNEVNTLLREHPEVERVHYKLWLTSTAVLEKILHSEVYQQSEILQEEIKDKLKLYVQSQTAYGKARKVLDNYNCCIISGIPGIGKTTLAEILLIYYLDQDYQIVKIQSDIKEALKAYTPGVKQVFLYDDFLGDTALEIKANKNEGKELISFMKHISRQKGKKFILTTREYILNQACQSDEELARQDFKYDKCVISLEDYTKADRARILYNHLCFYNISNACIEDLLVNKRIMNIINHPNYSPRLIESVMNLYHSGGGGKFYEFFMNTLSHPDKLWEKSFCRQISPAARDLLLLVCSFSSPVSVARLKECYEPYHRHKTILENRSLSSIDFKDALRETEGTFIIIDRSHISYHNPSVRDFIQGYLLENDVEYRMLCEGAQDFDLSIQLAGFNEDLCIAQRNSLIDAVKRTYNSGVQYECGGFQVMGNRAVQLARINKNLKFPEFHKMVKEFIDKIPDLLEEEQKNMTNENCCFKVAPHELRDILEGLKTAGYGESLVRMKYDKVFEYLQAWFFWSIIYSIEDFMLFRDLSSECPLEIDAFNFPDVYLALEDFRDNIAEEHIQNIDYESDCDEYLESIEALQSLFKIDLSGARMAAEERFFELHDFEDEEDDYEFREEKNNQLFNDGVILDMFQSLLERGESYV